MIVFISRNFTYQNFCFFFDTSKRHKKESSTYYVCVKNLRHDRVMTTEDTCDRREVRVNVEGITWLPPGDVPLVVAISDARKNIWRLLGDVLSIAFRRKNIARINRNLFL